jgi:hypothetical protein
MRGNARVYQIFRRSEKSWSGGFMDWWDTPKALVMQPDTSKALQIEKFERALIAQYQAILAQMSQ